MSSSQECLSGSTLVTKPSSAFSTASSGSAGSKLLFGEIDGSSGQSFKSCRSACSLILSSNSTFIRFWINDDCRETLLSCLPHSDLANLRLVCHQFGERASPLVFNDMKVSFKPSTFSRPAKLAALDRIGHHVRKLTFHFPRTLDTMLPPLIDPWTGETREFIWKPQVRSSATVIGKVKQPRYGDWETTDLLVKQYPPLFHAATNVAAFIQAFSAMPNLEHLHISCPATSTIRQSRMDIVNYAIISVRIAVERARLWNLDSLTLSPVHLSEILHLSPMVSAGAGPGSAKHWTSIRNLDICMAHSPNSSGHTDHLKLLHAYIRSFRKLQHLSFRWLGEKGPSPLPWPGAGSPSTQQQMKCHPALRPQSKPVPMFPRLTHLTLENAILPAPLIAALLSTHKHSLEELNLETVALTHGTWDDALGSLDNISGNKLWRDQCLEVGDVPIMLETTFPLPNSQPRTDKTQSGKKRSAPAQTHRNCPELLESENLAAEQVRRILLGSTCQASLSSVNIPTLSKEKKKRKKRDKGWAGEQVRKACGGILRWRI